MEQIISGKELCDIFFERLLERKDIDLQIASLLHSLYKEGNLKKEIITQSLQLLRQDSGNVQNN
jgi:hypothetical protein